MNPKTLIAAILAGQIANAALLPRVVTLHLTSTITATVTPTEAAGSNPSNAALPSRFSSPSEASTTIVTLSSFSDASPSHTTETPSSPPEKTKTVYKTVRVPYFITVKSECEVKTTTVEVTSTVTSEAKPSSTKTKWSYPLPEKSTAEATKPETTKTSAEAKPEEKAESPKPAKSKRASFFGFMNKKDEPKEEKKEEVKAEEAVKTEEKTAEEPVKPWSWGSR